MTGYELSRQWFDWCFENPDKITPTHTAMYFFIIEHCNRLGWKEKFGLPMEMTKDALGIRNYRTYSKVFNNLVDWGFIKLLENSKNQYSSNIIAIVNFTKAPTNASTKALDRALQKQLQKQCNSIVGIDKPITEEPITDTWRTNFKIYKQECKQGFKEATQDAEFIKKLELIHTGFDIKKSIFNSYESYWKLEDGWKNKKSGKTTKIDWKATIIKTIKFNLVK